MKLYRLLKKNSRKIIIDGESVSTFEPQLSMYYFLLFFLFTSCENLKSPSPLEPSYLQGEYIYRNENEVFFAQLPPQKNAAPSYCWQKFFNKEIPFITKEHFRCKGCSSHLPKSRMNGEQEETLFDCEGFESHSLPLSNEQEFIYPILIDLLNFIQNKTQKKVIITAGHRCPNHHSYIALDGYSSRYSKHLIGAEVSFYVETFEDTPEKIVYLLQSYYSIEPIYDRKDEYENFKRWEQDTDISTTPWYNKEIFIKLYKAYEGRNGDNVHPYPYISIQVRFDIKNNTKVTYTWDAAMKNYWRK